MPDAKAKGLAATTEEGLWRGSFVWPSRAGVVVTFES